MPLIRETLHAILDFIFPPSCPVCGRSHDTDRPICPDCHESIRDRACRYGSSDRILPDIDHVSVLLPYDETCRSLVHALKYHGMKSLGPLLGGLMAGKILDSAAVPRDAAIVPVPLHPVKLRERGYNQSERLAAGFADRTGGNVVTGLISRIRYTGTQTALGPDDRAQNVSNAFGFSGANRLSGRPAVIIDDVLTTGSTLAACARALKTGGAGTITVSVIATPDMFAD